MVEGYLSKLIGQGWSPENMPERGEWFWKDVDRMADWCGGEERGVQPVLVDVIDREWAGRPYTFFPSPLGGRIIRDARASYLKKGVKPSVEIWLECSSPRGEIMNNSRPKHLPAFPPVFTLVEPR